MEKFAVDLDKVLDDFEFNEDRAEQLACVIPSTNQIKPPPYRRPHFEPINLAEADFAAAPGKPYLREPTDSDDSESDTDTEESQSPPESINTLGNDQSAAAVISFSEMELLSDQELVRYLEEMEDNNMRQYESSNNVMEDSSPEDEESMEDRRKECIGNNNNTETDGNFLSDISTLQSCSVLNEISLENKSELPVLISNNPDETRDIFHVTDKGTQARDLEATTLASGFEANRIKSSFESTTTASGSEAKHETDSFEASREAVVVEAPLCPGGFETQANTYILENPKELGSFNTLSEVVDFEAPREIVSFEAPKETVGFEATSKVVGFEAPKENVDFKAPKGIVDFEEPREIVDFQVPSKVVGFEPPREVVSFETPYKVFGFEAPKETVGFEAPKETVDFEEPREIVTFEAPSNVVSFEAPNKSVDFEEPREIVVFETSSKVVSFEAPKESVDFEEPTKIVGFEAPSKVVGFEAPSKVVSFESPKETVDFEEPGEIVGFEAPSKAVGFEASTKVVGFETPAETVGFEAPMKLVGLEAPSDVDGSEATVSAYHPVNNLELIPTPMVQSPQDGEDIHVFGEVERPTRPKYLLLTSNMDQQTVPTESAGSTPAEALNIHADPSTLSVLTPDERGLGKLPPFWTPDQDAANCMHCDLRFTVLKRRHHCRACGKVLCGKCCGLKFRLEYLNNSEGRVCQPCHDILLKVLVEEQGESATGSPTLLRQPNPNNPMEYCSTIPPHQQEANGANTNPPSVLVPVLKREGQTNRQGNKQVMFSDGIRPGGDLTELDGSAEPRLPFRRPGRSAKRVGTPPERPQAKVVTFLNNERGLPPIAQLIKGDMKLDDHPDPDLLLASLKSETEPPVLFAINKNLLIKAKILYLSCCVNKTCWCFTTQGLSSVGQDEVMLVLEVADNETSPHSDVFAYFNTLYQDAVRGSTVSELGCTLLSGPFLGSNNHGAFIYIRPQFQCLNKLVEPSLPYLVAILVHRSETPWARVFPIRLMLRLGAEFRYYPCSLVSVRNRKPVYREIGHTIMNLLADFRNLSYTLPGVRGLLIHMEDRHTSILLPKNRYDQVTRALNNSNEHVLAFAANLSLTADSHLVCVQSENDETYHTQAINIHNKPRKVTGASFVVFNGALKTCSNLTAKSSIVEDGLMVQITPDMMQELRTALRNMKDFVVGCGAIGADAPDEVVNIKWIEDDKHFNVGVFSMIDKRRFDGIPSIRVHNGTDYLGRTRLIRWTEVFILQSEESNPRTEDPLDVGRLSESIARATCNALVQLLDLLAQAEYTKIAVRATIHPENVGYEVGSRGETLPPIYMNSLDNELVPVLHTAAASNQHTDAILELVFHVLMQ